MQAVKNDSLDAGLSQLAHGAGVLAAALGQADLSPLRKEGSLVPKKEHQY
jgi:X-X-X-Leu-X-X-Gly heptad repeat protein